MFKKIIGVLTSVPATVVGGAFLVLSFALPKFGVALPVDPAWVTVIICGVPVLYSAVRKLIQNRGISKISSALLISSAMAAATVTGDLFAAGEVAFIMAIGELLEDLTTDRAKKGLKKLVSLAPVQGRKILNGKEKIIKAENIRCGDILHVLPGETVPVDGIIISGETSVDQSVITGESLPVDKKAGDELFCATVNRFGAVDMRATSVGQDSSLQKLIRLVKQAQDHKAPMARIADKAASWLVPLAGLVAVISGLATGDVTRAVTVLVVFCPCALVLATPTAIMAAIGQAAKHGVIIKSGEALEKMGRADTIAFDKTGTLTFGQLEVCDVILSATDITEHQLTALAASAEARSEHPLGKAVVSYAKQKNIELNNAENFKTSAGKGVFAVVDNVAVYCGSESFLAENNITSATVEHSVIELLRKQGKALIFVAKDGVCIGVIALSDVIRPEAAKVIEKLKNMNTHSLLLTGDNAFAAQYFADNIGIDNINAGLLPENKVEIINKLRSENKTVCMIGDGVNDAPALKAADIGVAMGSMGSDIAVEAADIALMGDDISKIPYLKRLSVAAIDTIRVSIVLSMLINILAVILSVFGLLTPVTGALVHNAGSIFVVLIAALLYDRKIII